MKKIAFVIASMLMITQLQANNSASSEMSHVVGGSVLAGGITAVVNSYYPEYKENRGMIGFEISSAAIIVEQSIEFALHGNAKGQILDAISHIAGSAFGAFVTDKYILAPVINTSPLEGKSVGLTLQHSF
ncbi:MAG: hypothetical protein PHQ22_03320 [Sulfuricurvum sp.]|nr:hypothetical protein [Sulfuricurvum sp.]MDD5386205.1 hypothetical protein [Sulfuricurvum sp.]